MEVRTDGLRLIGDVDPALLVELGRDLELFRRFVETSDVARWPERVAPFTIVVVGERSSYDAFTSSPIVAGWFAVGLRGSYATVNLDGGFSRDEPDRNVLIHEYVHFLLACNSGFFYPQWYEEGFAEYLSTFRVDEEGGVDVGLPSEPRIRQLAMKWIPMDQLLSQSPPPYAQAWVTVHYLSSHPDRSTQLMEYLRLYDAGLDSTRALAQAFDVDARQLQGEIREYYRRGQYPYVRFEPGALGVVDPPGYRLLEQDEVLVALGALFLNAGQDRGAARKLFEKALEADPSNAESQAGLAAVSLASGDLVEARARVESALALDSENGWAHTLRGHLLLREAMEQERPASSRDASLLEARSAYRRAIELEPDVPDAYRGMAMTFRADPAQGDHAIEWLEQAHRLQPLDVRLSLDLAALRIERRELAQARRLLEWVIDGHDREALGEARSLLRQLNRLERRTSPGDEV